MYCKQCGAQIPEGSAFCVSCGVRTDGAIAPQPGPPSAVPQPPYGQQPPYEQPPYEQQPYQQTYGPQSYQQTYDSQPYGQQPPQGQPPKKGKPKTWMFIAGGAVLLLAIAAILVFVVFKVSFGPASGDDDGLLSSGTMQAEFVNDAARVFSNAFSNFGGVDNGKLMTEPFDVDMEFKVDTGTLPVSLSLTAAYDKEKLGVLGEAMGMEIMLLLDGDTLYVSDPEGSVTGYRFDTDADLSKPMTLKQRISALTKGLSGSSGADYMIVIEAMVDSISEDCFKTGKNNTTLTLTPDDVVEMLNTLAKKAKKDGDLSDALEELDMDIDDAIDSVESEEDFTLVVTVGYDGKTPISLEVDYDDTTDYGAFHLQFGYEDDGDDREIALKAESYGQEIEGSLSIARDGSDVEYDGKLTVSYDGTPYETYTLIGAAAWDGDEVEGVITVADGSGSEFSLKYSGTVSFKMPKSMVEDDKRFSVDTRGADIQDIAELFGSGGFDYPATVSEYPTDYPAVTEAPAGYGRIAVIVPTADTSYYAALLEKITSEASYYGWTVEMYSTNYSYMGEVDLLSGIIAGGYDGVIIDPVGMDDASIQSLEDMCNAAGMPCALLLDEGETADGDVGAVWCDLVYAGADMAYQCPYGNVFIIGYQYSNATGYLEQGLLYDSTFGISAYQDISVMGMEYAYDAASISGIVDSALSSYSIDTFICTDRDLSYTLFEDLVSRGYSGTMLCYTYETTMNETYPYAGSVYMTYEYFAIGDLAYYCVMAIADQTQHGLAPQVYTVTSYSY
jgi:hypothetical protein